MLISVPGVGEHKGKIRFKTYLVSAQDLAGTTEEQAYGRQRSAYFDNDDSDDSDDSSDSDSDFSNDEQDRHRMKSKDWKYWRSLWKRIERRN